MKIFKKRYYFNLFKTHIFYFLANFSLLSATIFIAIFSLQKIAQNNKKINNLNIEIKTLIEKQNDFQVLKSSQIDFDKTLMILNSLVPNDEDYFSILYALEILSQKTGFQINSYTVNLSENSPNRLKLTVSGVGSQEVFLNFLKQYNFGGHRLITSDNLSLSPQQQSGFKIDLTFYSNEYQENIHPSPSTVPNNWLQEIKKILAKTEFILKENSSKPDYNLNYPRKANPFSLE